MVSNVYKFRRIKWGDPEQKLKMLSDGSSNSRSRNKWDLWPVTVVLVFVVTFFLTCGIITCLPSSEAAPKGRQRQPASPSFTYMK